MAKTSVRHAKNPSLVAFGEAIRRVRARTDASQEGLALAAELDRSYVGGIERGEVNVALVNIVKLAAALGLTVEALMKEAGL